MTAHTPLRVGILGYGTAGRLFHAPFLAADPAFHLTAVVTANPERAEAARGEHAGVRVLPDADALWEVADALDVVVIATPSGTHASLAEQALRAGCHVVVDKPFVARTSQGEHLIRLAAELGRVLTVYQNRRWDGDFLTILRLLRSGRLGEIRRFESRFEWWQPKPVPTWKSTASVADAGGVLFDLGTHLVDQALQLFGPVRRVGAEIDTRRAGFAADDDVFLALEHDSGVRSHLWMSAVAPAPGPRFRVVGSRAAYTSWPLDGQEAALRSGARPGDEGFGDTPREAWGVVTSGAEVEEIGTVRGDYGRFYAGLAEALHTGAPAPVDPADSLAALRVIERARAASRGPIESKKRKEEREHV